MKELKQILIARIEDIYRLRNYGQIDRENEDIQNKYDMILEQKRNERVRTIKETQLIMNLNYMTFTSIRVIEQFYDISVEIMKSFDQSYVKYQQKFSVCMKDNIKKLYMDFFNENGFKHKKKLVIQICSRGLQNISPSMLLGWLSQWSKKIYCQMLQQQIKNCINIRKQKKIHNIQTTTPLKRKQTTNLNTSQNNIQFSENNAFLINRITIYGYFYEDLQNYYKFIGSQKLDINYLKSIRRQGKKQQLLKIGNLNKAAQMLIQTTQNKQIKSIMEEYEKGYRQKFPLKNDSSVKKKSYLKPLKKINTQSENVRNNSKLLSPKNSKIQFINPGQLELKMNRLRQINKKVDKNNNQFPNFKGIVHNQKRTHQLNKYIISKPNIRQLPLTQIQRRIKSNKFFQNLQKIKNQQDKALAQQHKTFGQKNNISNILVAQKYSQIQQTSYDDTKIKAGRRFTIADLRKNSLPCQKKNLKKLTNS